VPTATPITRRRHRHPVQVVPTPTPTLSPLPTPKVTLPPVALPTISLPPVHLPKSPCDLAKVAVHPHATASWPVQSRNADAEHVLVDYGSAWFTETLRGTSSYDTAVVGIDLATGKEWRSATDPFFSLFDVTKTSAWGIDNDGLVQFDLSSGEVADRWTAEDFVTHDGEQLDPESLQVSTAGVFVLGAAGNDGEGVSLLDPSSGSVKWSIMLPHSDGLQLLGGGPGNGLGVIGNDAYVGLVVKTHGIGVLRSWRVGSDGAVAASRVVRVPHADPDSEFQTAAGPDGFYVDVSINGDLDGVIVRLDPADLQVSGVTAVPVVEDLAAGPTGVWVVSLGCGPFVWFRYDAGLRPAGKPWRMPDDSYTVDASGQTVWSLRTVSPARAVTVAGFTPS